MDNHEKEATEAKPNNRRLVLFPLPFQGHINPMLQLANILHTKGFKITIIHTEFNSPNQSNYPQFTFISISDGLPKSKDEIARFLNIGNFMNKSCVDLFTCCLAKLLEEEHVACLISDAVWHFTQLVQESLRLCLAWSFLKLFGAMSALPSLGEKDDFKTSIEVEWAPELALMTKTDIKKICNGKSEESKLLLISNTIKGTKAASGMIVNTFKELEEPAFLAISLDFHIPTFPIGPFHKYFPASSSSLLEPDKRSISWLDVQPNSAVVYESFGSIAQLGEDEFTNMAWGLANSKQRFLWVIRSGSVSGSEWLELLPKGFTEEVGDRGCIVKWAPQQEVLAHQAIGAFWTYNGWNSTSESICEGVPMICSPCSYDQPVNARYVTDVWKIGVMLDNGMDREEIGRSIKRVIVDKEGNEMRQRSKSLQKKFSLSLQEGGSAHQSLKNLVDYIIHF